MDEKVVFSVSSKSDEPHLEQLCALLDSVAESSAVVVIPRTREFIRTTIRAGHAIIARVASSQEIIGYGYIEIFSDSEDVTHGGLVVHPQWRAKGVGSHIKQRLTSLTLQLFPSKRLIGLTVCAGVLTIGARLGFGPVPITDLTSSAQFWGRCKLCRYYDILSRFDHKQCLCVGMVYGK